MERMVTDPGVTKVIMVCDRAYAEKADSRRGGAGTEAQIISPALYGKTDQDKFVAVIRERDIDGKEYVPTFFKGRIYIDMLEESAQVEQFERLVRWCFGKPLDIKPALGKPPAYITDHSNVIRLATSVPFRRAIDAIRNSRGHAQAATAEYLRAVIIEMEKLRIGGGEHDFDDKVIASIEAFTPQRNELIELFVAVAQYTPTLAMAEVMHRFFEGIIPYMHQPRNVGQWHTWDFDNFRFIILEILLHYLGTILRLEKFEMAEHFVSTTFFMGDLAESRREPMNNYSEFMQEMRSLHHRENRLKTNRRLPEAALLSERCKGVPTQYRDLNAADLVLYLRGRRDSVHWYPVTLIGFRYRSIQIEMFARARAHTYFERIKGVLGVANEREFVELVQKQEVEARERYSGYGDMRGLSDLVGLDAIALNVR